MAVQLVVEKLRKKWPGVVCTIWPAVMESDSGQSEDRARSIAKVGCVVRRVRLLVSNVRVGEAHYKTPVGLAKLVEEPLFAQLGTVN